MPKILFVIVSYNAKRYMQECIQSIREKITPGCYKIVVVDNASTDGIAEWLMEQDDILLIRNETNIGFGPGCNQAVKATYGTEYADYDIFLLNNDTVMTQTAVPRMLDTLYSADDIGAVGCMSSYAGNRQEYPVFFNTTEEYINYGESLSIPKSDAIMERTRLNGFAMLIKRNLWDEIGGFDEDFAPGYYEDDALSIEIQKHGYRLLLRRDSFIYHVGSASFVKTGTNKLSYEHHELFIQKYGFDILNYVYPCGAVMSQIPFSRDAAFSVLYIGCGLGAEIKAIRSFYPNARLYGVEENSNLYDIVSKTETVYTDISNAAKSISDGSINLLIIDSNYLSKITENDKSLIVNKCVPNAVEINRLHEYDSYPFDDTFLVCWANELFSPTIARILFDRGIINITAPKEEISDISSFARISCEHTLVIDSGNYTIVPYLAAFFSRKPSQGCENTLISLTDAFMRRYKDSRLSTDKDLFIKGCCLNACIHTDCHDHINEISKLIAENNLLYGTEIPTDKNHLERFLLNDWNSCGYLTANDKYADYGLVGFFCFNNREKTMLIQSISWLVADYELEYMIKEYVSNPKTVQNNVPSGRIRILIKGDKSLSPIEEYLIGGNITTEYDNHQTITNSIEPPLPTLINSSEFHIIIYSLLQYDYESWKTDGDKCLANLLESLDSIYDNAPGKPSIILLLGSELYFDSADVKSCELAELYSEINPIIADFAADHDRVRIVNCTDFITDTRDFDGYINHFGVRAFSDIAEKICQYINDVVDELLNNY